MLFNSKEFLVFFVVILAFYYRLDYRYRWILLLSASFFFYGYWNWTYVPLLLLSIGIDYSIGILIEEYNSNYRMKKILMLLSCLANLGLLGYFKYTYFILESTQGIINFLGGKWDMPNLNILLPIGISFYTFQTLSYTIDIYKGRRKAERHIGYFALYVTYFPQLVAGPIERSSHLIPQFKKKIDFEYERFLSGILQSLWGLSKKLIIADRLSIFVNSYYSDVSSITSGWHTIFVIYVFMIQIYCDFSGYSDIAIGISRILGIDLITNFKQPLLATTYSEFWSRWHISLTEWFSDYVFKPLNRINRNKRLMFINYSSIFLLSGLWHGADWSFIVWGGLQPIFVYSERFARKKIKRFRRRFEIPQESKGRSILGWVRTFTLISASSVFFRAENVSEGLYVLSTVKALHWNDLFSKSLGLNASFYDFGLNEVEFKFACFSVVLLFLIDYLIQKRGSIASVIEDVLKEPLLYRHAIFLVLFFSIIIFGVYGSNEPANFIYFQF